MDVRQVFEAYKRGDASQLHFRYCPRCKAELVVRQTDDRPRPHCPDCGFVQYINPGPGVAILIVDGNRFLLGRRVSGSFRGSLVLALRLCRAR